MADFIMWCFVGSAVSTLLAFAVSTLMIWIIGNREHLVVVFLMNLTTFSAYITGAIFAIAFLLAFLGFGPGGSIRYDVRSM